MGRRWIRKAEGGEDAMRIATLVRMFIIWLILMYGSLFVLVAAAIQLALA
jgi:hypothetical protein